MSQAYDHKLKKENGQSITIDTEERLKEQTHNQRHRERPPEEQEKEADKDQTFDINYKSDMDQVLKKMKKE